MSINEADLPTSSRRFNVTTLIPQGHATTSSVSTELPEGSRKFTTTVAFPQSHVTVDQADDTVFVTGGQGKPGEPGPPGDDAQWEKMTQADYDALPTKDPNTLYVIIG